MKKQVKATLNICTSANIFTTSTSRQERTDLDDTLLCLGSYFPVNIERQVLFWSSGQAMILSSKQKLLQVPELHEEPLYSSPKGSFCGDESNAGECFPLTQKTTGGDTGRGRGEGRGLGERRQHFVTSPEAASMNSTHFPCAQRSEWSGHEEMGRELVAGGGWGGEWRHVRLAGADWRGWTKGKEPNTLVFSGCDS